jgi:hypothetical protein
LINHISEHVHSFSLRALPWAQNEAEEDEGRIEASVKIVEGWFARWLTEDKGQKHSPISNKKKKEEEDNYFAQNDYFAESFGRKSLGQDESLFSDERDLEGLPGEGSLRYPDSQESATNVGFSDNAGEGDTYIDGMCLTVSWV